LIFANPEDTRRAGIIRMNRGTDITVSSCQADFPWTAGPFFFCGSGVNITLENNISRGGDYPICIAGKNIKVRNNTIVDATMLSTNFWAVEDLEISNNIFMRPCINNKRNPALMLSNIKGTVVCDGNVFWSPIAEHPVGGWVRDKNSLILKQSKTLAEWQQLTGWDKNSIHADPMFVDYEKGDFRLREGSPAAGKGAVIQ